MGVAVWTKVEYKLIKDHKLALPYTTKSKVLIYMTAIKEIIELFPKQFLTRKPFLTTLIHF